MDKQNLAKIGLVVVALAAAGYFGVKNARSFSSENPDITTKEAWFLCAGEKCGKSFQISVGESRAYAREHAGADLPCPACGLPGVLPAAQCRACAKIFLLTGHGGLPKTCPHCKAPVPRDLLD